MISFVIVGIGCQSKEGFHICSPTGGKNDASANIALAIVRLSTPVITLN